MVMTTRLNENMMTNNEATTEIIISAKRDMGSPHIMALLRMFRYTSYFLSLYNNSNEIGEDANDRSCNQYKYQNTGNTLF